MTEYVSYLKRSTLVADLLPDPIQRAGYKATSSLELGYLEDCSM